MLPIVSGCRALLINLPSNPGEVLVGNKKLTTHKYKVWKINKLLEWEHLITGKRVWVKYCPERYLMRIDGGDFKTTDIGQYQSKPCTEIVA